MPPKRPAPIQIPPRTASSNMRSQIDLESQGILGRIKRHEDMDAAFTDSESHMSTIAKITCAVIRPVGREIICIAVKQLSDYMGKVIPINTIFFYNKDDKMWLPMSSIFNSRPSDISGYVEERIHALTNAAERERRSLMEFRAHPDVASIRKYGVFGGMVNAICSQLLKEHSDDIIELAEDEGKIAVFTQDDLGSFDVNELKRTPDGFFDKYIGQCVSFAVPVEHHKRHKKVHMKTRPDEKKQNTIDALLSARFEGLRLPRESRKSKSIRRFGSSRKARSVMLRKLSKKAKKPASKKPNNKLSKNANNGAAKPDNTPK